jgi:hypothetical protein
MSTQANISANVRRKGRPKLFINEPEQQVWLEGQFPDQTCHRRRVEHLNVAAVRKILHTEVGEDPRVAAGSVNDRPKSVARWPWLFGKRVQHTVLLQLYRFKDYPETVVSLADQIEKLRREDRGSAKDVIRALRVYVRKCIESVESRAVA